MSLFNSNCLEPVQSTLSLTRSHFRMCIEWWAESLILTVHAKKNSLKHREFPIFWGICVGCCSIWLAMKSRTDNTTHLSFTWANCCFIQPRDIKILLVCLFYDSFKLIYLTDIFMQERIFCMVFCWNMIIDHASKNVFQQAENRVSDLEKSFIYLTSGRTVKKIHWDSFLKVYVRIGTVTFVVLLTVPPTRGILALFFVVHLWQIYHLITK